MKENLPVTMEVKGILNEVMDHMTKRMAELGS
jgi:hypothetical protein